MNELVRRFNNSDLSINLTSILILNNETNEFEPWFIAKEVATLLGYEKTKEAVNRHVDELDQKILSYNECKELFGQNIISAETIENTEDFRGPINEPPKNTININSQGMKFINESGLYTLIARSDKCEARKFQRWVTSEVLPSIRKTGSYNIQKSTPSYEIEDPIERAKAWIVEQEAKRALEAKNNELTERLAITSDERDEAIKHRHHINSKRVATLMQNDGVKTRKINDLTTECIDLTEQLNEQTSQIIDALDKLDTVNHQKALVESKLDVILSNMYSVDDVYHRVENLFHTGYQPSTLRSKLRKELNRISYMFGEVPKAGVNKRNPEHNPPKYYTKRVVEQIIDNGKNDPMYFKHLKG